VRLQILVEYIVADFADPRQLPFAFDEAAIVFEKMHAAVLGQELELDRSDASVHRLGAALTRGVRDRLASERAGERESVLFQVVVHGSAYVGACIVKNHGGVWAVRRPLWESLVRLKSHAGEGELPIFHWWLKSLADESFADDGSVRYGLAERYRAHVEVPRMDPAALPVFVEGERKLPRISKVRYDVLYKYLKAHLPELRDLGKDFPSPERFDAYRFKWLDAFVLGGGKMVLLAGPGEGGLHAFWLDGTGFQKAALYAANAFPEPKVVVIEDKLRMLVSHDGAMQTHELLWWGP
jgi:hypothetical protein